MQVADDCITPLRRRHPLVNQVVDLLQESLAADAEDATLPRREEVDGAGLEGVARVVDLLGEVERVVHRQRPRARLVLTQAQASSGDLRRRDLHPVESALDHHMPEVDLLTTQTRRLLIVRAVGGPIDDAVVLLALPAEVGRRLAADDLPAQLMPDTAERSQLHHSVTWKQIRNVIIILQKKCKIGVHCTVRKNTQIFC